jgi:hypothetical protein
VYLAAGFYGEFRCNQSMAERLTSLADGIYEGMRVLVDVISDW